MGDEAPEGLSTSDRGFKRFEAVPSTYGGEVKVYESSAAEGPHLWLNATAPVSLNEPDGAQVTAALHITLDAAALLRDQLDYLVQNHYQRVEEVEALAEALPPPVQPEPGGTCDECGHYAARHDEKGCHFPRPPETSPCTCQAMVYAGVTWPRPWLPAPEGLRADG